MTQRGKVTVLLFFFSLCATAALLNYFIEERSQAIPQELYAVVYRQLNAFQAEDFRGAYSSASVGFQRRFTVDEFTDMIRTDYSSILRARRVEFGVVERRGRHALLQVFFVDGRGGVTPCIYSLVSENDGWKIDGARFLQRWPTGQRLTGVQV